MKQNWERDELIEHFTILLNEMTLIELKSGENQLGFAVLLKFFQHQARFPTHPSSARPSNSVGNYGRTTA